MSQQSRTSILNEFAGSLVENRYRASSDGYWLGPEHLVAVFNGIDNSTRNPVQFLVFSPTTPQNSVDRIFRYLTEHPEIGHYHSGVYDVNLQGITYIVSAPLSQQQLSELNEVAKGIAPPVSLPPQPPVTPLPTRPPIKPEYIQQGEPTPPEPIEEGPQTNWAVLAGIPALLVCLLLVIGSAFFYQGPIPIIRPPTPTPTMTPASGARLNQPVPMRIVTRKP